MLKIYPAIFHQEDNSYWVEFPDLEGCQTCGTTLEETMELAQEALGLYLSSLMENSKTLPQASALSEVTLSGDGFINYVSTNVEQYFRNTKAVKKTVSMPAWLAEEAEKRNLSFSYLLQTAIKDTLSHQI